MINRNPWFPYIFHASPRTIHIMHKLTALWCFLRKGNLCGVKWEIRNIINILIRIRPSWYKANKYLLRP